MAAGGIGLIVITLVGIGMAAIGWLGWLERLPPNHFAGIRTPFTMRSPENWYRTHHAAAPLLIFGGIAVVAVGISCIPFVVADKLPVGFVRVVMSAQVGMVLASAFVSWKVGVSAAKRGK
jgi:uncharacterized membrane protein